MKKIILFTLLAIGSIFGQVDTSHIQGYTSGAQIKAILDRASTGDTSDYSVTEIDSLLNIVHTNDATWTAKQAPISNVADTTKYVEKSDSTLYATQNDIAGLGSGALDNVVEDITPQLGGTLDLNDKNVENTTPTFSLTPTELSYADRLTSNAQDQIDALFDSVTVLRDAINEYMAGTDSFPSPFTFTAQTGVARSTAILSNVQPLINFGTTIYPHINTPASGDSLRIKHSNTWGTWKRIASAVDGDSIQIKLTSSANYSTKKSDTLHVSNKTIVFDVTTLTDAYPHPPTSLAATPTGSTTATVTWTDPADADLDSIRIYQKATTLADTVLTWVASVNEGVQTKAITGLTASTTYNFAAKTKDDGGNISQYFSNRDTANTFATPPPAGEILSDGFESGDFSEWNGRRVASGSFNIATDTVKTGTKSAKFVAGGVNTDPAYNNYITVAANDNTHVYVRAYVKWSNIHAWDAGAWGTIYLMSLKNNAYDSGGDYPVSGICFVPTTTGVYSVSIYDQRSGGSNGGRYDATGAAYITPFTWHCIEMHYYNGTGTNGYTSLKIDGDSLGAVTGCTDEFLVDSIKIGTWSVPAIDDPEYYYIDDVQIDTTGWIGE